MIRDAHIYVLRGVTGSHKVGVSIAPLERAKVVGGEVFLVSEIVGPAALAEGIAHKILWAAGKQVKGEWFSASVDECADAVMQAISVANGLSEWPDRFDIAGCAKRGFKRRSAMRQLTFRPDEEVEQAIEDIRKMVSPIPSVSEVLRVAVLDYRDKVARKVEAQKGRK